MYGTLGNFSIPNLNTFCLAFLPAALRFAGLHCRCTIITVLYNLYCITDTPPAANRKEGLAFSPPRVASRARDALQHDTVQYSTHLPSWCRVTIQFEYNSLSIHLYQLPRHPVAQRHPAHSDGTVYDISPDPHQRQIHFAPCDAPECTPACLACTPLPPAAAQIFPAWVGDSAAQGRRLCSRWWASNCTGIRDPRQPRRM